MFKSFFRALEVLEQTGSTDEVFQYVNQLDDHLDREDTVKKLAKFFAREGRLDEASRFTSAIRSEIERIYALQEVARELRRKGHVKASGKFLQDAYEMATNVKVSNWETANLFLMVSIELHEAGRSPEALALLRQAMDLAGHIPGGVGASKFLAACSGQLAKWNCPEEARMVADSIQHDWFRKHALEQLKESS